MKIEQVAISELQPYDKNSKKHPKEQVAKIRRSIEEFGFNIPILVDKDNVIIAGHGRLLADKEMGLQEVPVMRKDDLSSQQIKAYRIADNKTAESAWEMDFLKEEFLSLDADGYSLDLTGFDFDEIAKITGKEENLQDVEPEDHNTIQTDIVLGQIYQLGKHRLMCGDTAIKDNVVKLMDGNMARMSFTDPPWNVAYGSHTDTKRFKHREIQNDDLGMKFGPVMASWFNNYRQVMENGAMLYVAMSAQEWGTLMGVLQSLNFHWSSTIIWAKDTLVLSRKDYHTQYEPVWYGWLGDKRLYPLEDRKQSDLWVIPRPKKSDEHPTMKPIELCARAIRNSSAINDIVIDFFGGSGSTLIAADQLNRICYMMELDPKYCQVIINRWEKLTGKTAVKVV
jgi:DNA modification methylase